jgi:DNA-binding transcriptional MerR regulator
VLPEPARSLGGHRDYDESAVASLRIVKAAQRLGFTLDEVAELINTGRRRHPAPDLQRRAEAKLAEVEGRFEDLIRMRDGLRQVIDARCTSLTHCTCPEGSLHTSRWPTQPAAATTVRPVELAEAGQRPGERRPRDLGYTLSVCHQIIVMMSGEVPSSRGFCCQQASAKPANNSL